MSSVCCGSGTQFCSCRKLWRRRNKNSAVAIYFRFFHVRTCSHRRKRREHLSDFVRQTPGRRALRPKYPKQMVPQVHIQTNSEFPNPVAHSHKLCRQVGCRRCFCNLLALRECISRFILFKSGESHIGTNHQMTHLRSTHAFRQMRRRVL